ncbi:MAG: SusD/RagB family nutrient-binding outer membrane lipoprotein [Prevotella sp.]|jgi:hypothetical protein|nr:SusD/RagB family nutrient-binding outer membrane lipoprotein [Prevotella sp.]
MKQYNLKTILTAIILSFAVLFTPSCTGDFDNLNRHPTNSTEDDFAKSERLGSLFSSLIATMHYAHENRSQMIDQMIGNQYGGYMVTTNNWQGTNFGTFNPATDWVDFPFRTIMVDFNSNFIKVKKVTESKGYIYGWASILRVATMLRVADIYGPIPYSRIGLVDSDAIEYDNVQDLYHNMIADLDYSIAVFKSYLAESPSESSLAEYDVVYWGDFAKWLKLANSLKLRLAVRIALVDTEYAKKAIAEAIAGGPVEANADNAFIPTRDNPYYKSSHSWGDLAISATLSSFMNGYDDPRAPVYMTFCSFGSTYRGVRMGIENIINSRYSNAAYFSKPAFTANSPLMVFCAAETAFLKAEAALRGWIAGGDARAKTYYEEGVRLSMEQHNVSIGNYLAGTTSPETNRDIWTGVTINVERPITVSWDDTGATQNTRLEKIITQKWLANYPLGFEAWCDHRRTGFPQFFPAVNNLGSSGFIGAITNTPSRMARRLPFPQIQYQGNYENVRKAVQMLGGDDAAYTDLWWAKKR